MQDANGPHEGRIYGERRQPYTIGAPMSLPEGFTVMAENILTWTRDDEFYTAHELVARTPSGEVRATCALLDRGDLGAARLSSYRGMGAVHGGS